LLVGDVEIPLSRGEVLLGRSRSCQIVLDDVLVSRHHARLLVSRSALFIEDLGSSNGVVVNEARALGPTPVDDGSRIIVGTQELVVRATDEDARDEDSAEESGPRAQRKTPEALPRVSISSVPPKRSTLSPPDKSAKGTHPGADAMETTQNTAKQDGLLTMARLADRMISMGRHDAAARLVGDHLIGVLEGAKADRAVPPDVLELVGIYGTKLSEVTHVGQWTNVAIELYTLCRRPLPERAIASLEVVVARVPSVDRSLLLRYKAVIRDAAPDYEREQQALIERIIAIPTR